MSLEPVEPPPRRSPAGVSGCLLSIFVLLLVWVLVGVFIRPLWWPWWW